jgi:hypothetical protein
MMQRPGTQIDIMSMYYLPLSLQDVFPFALLSMCMEAKAHFELL